MYNVNMYVSCLYIICLFFEIVPRNVYNCGSRDDEADLCVIQFLDTNGEGVEGDTASQDKTFSEIWELKIRV